MSIIHFQQIASFKADFDEFNDGSLVKDALVLVEGTHNDSKGNSHTFTTDRVREIADNTNREIDLGTEVPLMADHASNLLGEDGDIKKLGEIVSKVKCRIITEDDLPNRKQTFLLGKLGAFSKVKVANKINEVKNGTIRLLSPGIDPVANKLVEISAVAFPAISGPALFAAQRNQISFSNHGLTNYKKAKAQIESWQKPKEELQKLFDIFLGTVVAIQQQEQQNDFAANHKAMLRKSLEDFTEDVANYLHIELDDIGDRENPENIYNPNPYSPQIVSPNNQFNKQGKVVGFSQKNTGKKRRRKIN